LDAGRFLGVDVFFVLSGHLITDLLGIRTQTAQAAQAGATTSCFGAWLSSARQLRHPVLMAEDPAAKRPSYEQARDELVELVKRLEAGGLTLEQSLDLWERGERLAAICEEWLEGARARLAAAIKPPDDDSDRDDPARPF
jgi:exodeoxyribonuclease VII small subunit